MTTNKPEPVEWGSDPRKMSEADLLPCPACGNQAGKATKRAAKGLPFVGLWKVSCQRHDCPLAMIYFHPVEWNRLPRIRQSEYAALQAKCEELRKDAETERAIQRAAEVLPEGWSIEIEVEKDAGSVAVLGPGAVVYGDFQGTIAEQILDAIDTAMQEAAHESH